MDAICRRLKESRILPEAFSWLTVAVDGFQGIQTDVREFARRCSNHRTVLLMKFLELGHESPSVHPYEIRYSSCCKELRTRVLPQRMNVKIIEDIGNGISYSLVVYISVSN